MPEDLKVGFDRFIGDNHPTFIIAEIGQNHQGDLTMAKKLIEEAKNCGADCVKFQKTNLQEKFNKMALKRPYQSENSWGKTYGAHKAHLEFSNGEFLTLKQFAAANGILFAATAMDPHSLTFLVNNDVPLIKIGSGDANNMLLIREAASKHVPLLISTGMQDLEMVKRIYNTVGDFHKKFALLHCVSSYPAPLDEVNLRVLHSYKKEFPNIQIGYSGHELGIHVSLAAVAMGAKIIERHFTLNKNQKGTDHACSLEPTELKALVTSIRKIEMAMGGPLKQRQPSEIACYEKLGKSVVASRPLQKGTTLIAEDVKVKVADPRGIDASLYDAIIGKMLKIDVAADDPIQPNYLD